MVIKSRVAGNEQEAVRLEGIFRFRQPLFLRAEQAQYYELVKKVPRLQTLRRVLDETVMAALFGKTKNLKEWRPDYFHF